MELSIATARALEAEALNFGAENGNVVFMYEHGEQLFWSVAYNPSARRCAWTFCRAGSSVCFFLLVCFVSHRAHVTRPEDGEGWSAEFVQAMHALNGAAHLSARQFRRALRDVRLAGHDRSQRWKPSTTMDTINDHEAYIRGRLNALPPYQMPAALSLWNLCPSHSTRALCCDRVVGRAAGAGECPARAYRRLLYIPLRTFQHGCEMRVLFFF